MFALQPASSSPLGTDFFGGCVDVFVLPTGADAPRDRGSGVCVIAWVPCHRHRRDIGAFDVVSG